MIRSIDPTSSAEIELVATRMRLTLIEVLGEEQGGAMYTMDWLKDRVLFHLDPEKSTAQIYLAVDDGAIINGHTIVRIEDDGSGKKFGLFSTTYVEPDSRKKGLADSLLNRGEKWMLDQGLTEAQTYTSDSNTKLIELYFKHGYRITERAPEKSMVLLAKSLVQSP